MKKEDLVKVIQRAILILDKNDAYKTNNAAYKAKEVLTMGLIGHFNSEPRCLVSKKVLASKGD